MPSAEAARGAAVVSNRNRNRNRCNTQMRLTLMKEFIGNGPVLLDAFAKMVQQRQMARRRGLPGRGALLKEGHGLLCVLLDALPLEVEGRQEGLCLQIAVGGRLCRREHRG